MKIAGTEYDGRRGSNNKTAKLTEEQVREIRSLRRPCSERGRMGHHEPEFHISVLAERYGVTAANITAIVNRYTWKHL
jgi:uncharacterized cysteine cluster protein YcgN (CxxCxxCC family)